MAVACTASALGSWPACGGAWSATFQELNLVPSLTAIENMDLLADLDGVPPVSRAEALQALALVGRRYRVAGAGD